jgi:hypothetical protein
MARNDGGPAATLTLSPGYTVLVSPEDVEILLSSKWRLGANGYVYRKGARIKGMPCLLHRIIVNAESGEEIHHRDGNKLNNLRENIVITDSVGHQQFHKYTIIARNLANRKYDIDGICRYCNKRYTKDPNHRGRQVCCSKKCGLELAHIKRRKQNV